MDSRTITERIPEVLKQWHEAEREIHNRNYPGLADRFDQDEQKWTEMGMKYIRLNSGTSGAFMVELYGENAGVIYAIKGYGTPDKNKVLGNIETIDGAILHRDRFRRGRFDNREIRYKVPVGCKYVYFATMEAANAFCNEVMRETRVVLTVLPVGNTKAAQ